MFDAFLRERASARRDRSCRSTRSSDYDEYVDGKPRYEGVRSFLGLARDRRCREGSRGRPAERRDDPRPRQPQERDRAAADPRATASSPTRARCATCARPATRGCGARSSPRAPTAATCCARPASRTCSRSASTASSPSASTSRGKPAPDTFLAGARRRSASRPAQAAVFEDALAGVEAGRAGELRLRGRRRPRRAGRGSSRAHGAEHRRRATSASCSSAMIRHPAFALEPWALRETRARPRRARADRVGVRALQRAHRAARQPRRGRAARPAGHLPERASTRSRPLPYAEAGYGYPEAGQSARQRHQRQDHPPARRRRAVRRPLRRAARATSACSTCATACCGAPPTGARRRARACACSSTRLVSFVQRAVAAICYEVEAVDAPAARRAPVRARRQRDAAGAPTGDPRDGVRCADAAAAGAASRAQRRRAPCSCTRRRASGLRDGRRRWTTSSTGPTAPRSTLRVDRGRGARDVRDRPRARASALRLVKFLGYGWSSQRSVPAVARPGRAARARGAAHRLGRAARRAARLPRRLLGARRRRDRGRRRAAAGGALLDVPLPAGGARAPSSARSRPRGSPAPGYDGHAFWDTESVRAAAAHLHRPAAPRATPCAGATPRSTWPRERAARARAGGRGLPVADDPRRRSARATGRPAPPRSTSTPTSPTRSCATRRPPTTRSSSATPARSCWSRPRACGARSATTTPTGASASTA